MEYHNHTFYTVSKIEIIEIIEIIILKFEVQMDVGFDFIFTACFESFFNICHSQCAMNQVTYTFRLNPIQPTFQYH